MGLFGRGREVEVGSSIWRKRQRLLAVMFELDGMAIAEPKSFSLLPERFEQRECDQRPLEDTDGVIAGLTVRSNWCLLYVYLWP